MAAAKKHVVMLVHKTKTRQPNVGLFLLSFNFLVVSSDQICNCNMYNVISYINVCRNAFLLYNWRALYECGHVSFVSS